MTHDKFYTFTTVMEMNIAPQHSKYIFNNLDSKGNGYLSCVQFQSWIANYPIRTMIELMTGLIDSTSAQSTQFYIAKSTTAPNKTNSFDNTITWQQIKFVGEEKETSRFSFEGQNKNDSAAPKKISIPKSTAQFKTEFENELSIVTKNCVADVSWHGLKQNTINLSEAVSISQKITINVVVVGAAGTGKTSLIKTILSDKPELNEAEYHPTAVDIEKKQAHKYHSARATFNIWDTSGASGRNAALQSLVTKTDVNLILGVFTGDVQSGSLEDLEEQLEMLNKYMHVVVPDPELRAECRIQPARIPILVVQTKADLTVDRKSSDLVVMYCFLDFIFLVYTFLNDFLVLNCIFHIYAVLYFRFSLLKLLSLNI